MKKEANAAGLLPILVFLIFYLGSGIYFEYINPVEGGMGFYVMSAVVAFMIGLAVAFAQNRELKFDDKITVCAKSIGDDNITTMLFIFLMAGAFSGTAQGAGGATSAANLLLSIIPSGFAVVGLFVIACVISMAMGTSCGTISVIVPVAMNVATGADLNMQLCVASVIGGAMFGVECKIVDPETGKELPDNVDGEFVARGYNIMKGYYKMPHATAQAIDADGWLHTGDLARRLPNGYFKITGRIKDMIIRGGENIYPKEIEDFIYTNPKVKDVQVIGVPDKQYGEEIMACVIKKDDSLTEEELREYIKANLAKHKVPRYIAFVDSFPMNAAGKILKYKMREQAVESLSLQDASKIETA